MAAPLAPVPEDIVSPTPRSKIRARMTPGSSSANQQTFVRLGNSSWSMIAAPIAGRSSASSSAASATWIAHCGLPTWTC